MPNAYRHASQDFDRFMRDAQEALGSVTSNTTYTTVQSVFHVFRRRLTLEQAIAFAGVLPAVLCAIFVQDWDPREQRRPFAARSVMEAEVKSIREHHNFSPDGSIDAVADVLRRHVDVRRLRVVLATISPEALRYWGFAPSD
ncbi:DUF2267 domain-containing protein [Bauldia sp.]|uniref:DUF2267 domain-containing protein n=1 Tax=Bauldia sp. TaxID=2575872 RepID=UPI003BAAB533